MKIIYSVTESHLSTGFPRRGKIRTEIHLDNGDIEAFESEWYILDWCQEMVDILNKAQK